MRLLRAGTALILVGVVVALAAAAVGNSAQPAAASGFAGSDGHCTGFWGDPDCYHYYGTYRGKKACDAAAKHINGPAEAGYDVQLHLCQVVRPSGHYELYIFDSACRADVPFRRCKKYY